MSKARKRGEDAEHEQDANRDLREEAKQRERAVTPASTVQFRVDGEIMELLNRVANHKRTPSGVLARMWVVERLYEEAEKMRAQEKR
ncbi:MAG: hypothetical protein U0105_12510 [Candidatus Obscuribacterales bacterium]|jgi:hypothetical protein